MAWLKFDDVQLDLPIVQFVVNQREAAVLRNQRGVDLVAEKPEDVEWAFMHVLQERFPEYHDAVLIGYGCNPSQMQIYFSAVHRHFPRTHWCKRSPQWHLLNRCDRPGCRGPLDAEDVQHCFFVQDGHCNVVRYYCGRCVEAGYNPPEPGQKPRTVDVYPPTSWDADVPVIHVERQDDCKESNRR